MQKILISSAILFSASLGFACGSEVGSVIKGEKVLGIELSDASSANYHGVAFDDDGVLAAGIVAAYCNQSLESANVKLDDQQYACVDQAQDKAKTEFDNRVYSYYGGKGDPDTLAMIKKECNLDLTRMLADVEVKIAAEPVTCGPKVKNITKKAAARINEYISEVASPEALAKLQLTEEKKANLLANLAAAKDALEQLATMTAQSNLTRSEFDPWVKNFMAIVKVEGFDVEETVRGETTKEKRAMSTILIDLNARLPGLPQSRCGFPISDKAIEKLSTGTWQSVPATTTGGGSNERAN
jgi:hypothetical protein